MAKCSVEGVSGSIVPNAEQPVARRPSYLQKGECALELLLMWLEGPSIFSFYPDKHQVPFSRQFFPKKKPGNFFEARVGANYSIEYPPVS